MKKRVLIISLSVVGAILLIALIGVAVVFLSGNQFTVARCIVTDNDSLYMIYDDRPIHLSYNGDTNYETGDKLLIVHQSAFAESYPEQARAYFIMKIGSGSEEDIPQKAFDILIETGNYGISSVGGADGPESVNITSLRERYPQYFNLDTMKGLQVYVWQMAKGTYSCGVLSGKNLGYTQEELWELHKAPLSIEEMRAVVDTYGISREKVTICPITMPHSSYAYTIDDEYIQNLEELFWNTEPKT